jgi:DNA-binding CsgD family transcriptional regulator
MLARRRQVLEAISLGEQGVGFAAWALEEAITPLFPLVPGFERGPDLLMLQSGGLVKLFLGLGRLEASRVGKTLMTVLLVWQMNRYAIEKYGVTLTQRDDSLRRDPRRFLNAAFSPTTRRLARRALFNYGRRLGMGDVTIDFAAMYRTGQVPAVTFLPAASVSRPGIPTSRDGVVMLLLAALVFACDCWALQENPLNVAFAALVQHGSRLWEAGSPEFRTAMTEALVLATCQTFPADKVAKLDRMEAVAVLEGDVLDWASSVVIAFHELRAHSVSRFRLMRFLRDLTNQAKRVGPEPEPTDSHLYRLGHKPVSLDGDPPVHVADDRSDPGRLIPDAHELRARLQIDRLTPQQRRVLALRMNDMPFDEIGNKLGISAATARVLMHRVRRASGRARVRHGSRRH